MKQDVGECLNVDLALKVRSADQSGLLALIRLPLGRGECGQPQLLGMLLDLKH